MKNRSKYADIFLKKKLYGHLFDQYRKAGRFQRPAFWNILHL